MSLLSKNIFDESLLEIFCIHDSQFQYTTTKMRFRNS